MGSAGAVFMAIHLGLRETLLVGGVMYLCAMISVQLNNSGSAKKIAAEDSV